MFIYPECTGLLFFLPQPDFFLATYIHSLQGYADFIIVLYIQKDKGVAANGIAAIAAALYLGPG